MQGGDVKVTDTFLSSLDICRLLEIDLSVLNRLEKEGILLPKYKLPLNGKRLYAKKDVDEYLRSIRTK